MASCVVPPFAPAPNQLRLRLNRLFLSEGFCVRRFSGTKIACRYPPLGVEFTIMAEMGMHQQLALGQALSVQMQQSLHLLQAPAMELQSLVQQELAANPVLEEIAEPPASEDSEPEPELMTDEIQAARDAEWNEYFSQSTNAGSRYTMEDSERRQFFFDSQSEAPKLSDHLSQQLALATNEVDLISAGDEIIGNLDENGFLKIPLEEIAMAAQVPYAATLKALELVQSFDPVGVAARSLQECLLLQLQRLRKGDEVEQRVVKDHLEDLGHRRYAQIAKALKVSQERINEAAQVIAGLNPRPVAAFAPEQKQNIVQPEVTIRKDGDDWIILLNDEAVPRLKIKDEYKDLLGTTGEDRSLRDYLREKIRNGKFLIKCLHQRQQTLNSIAHEILARQKEFFEQGVAHLKPLTMNQVAEVVGVHETTVSRAVSNKYVNTPHGVFEMKYFFTTGYQSDSGEMVSNTSVKDTIKEIISRENPAKPLSDEELAKILIERGIKVARRTVVKYRTAMGILPSHLRKKSP